MNCEEVVESTAADDGVVYAYIFSILNVDPICVWTERGRVYGNAFYVNSLTAIELNVELRTVLYVKLSQCQIGAHEEPNKLQAEIRVGKQQQQKSSKLLKED